MSVLWGMSLASILLLFSCGATKQAREGDITNSGFLQDYSLLEEGVEGTGVKTWIKPGASLEGYDKLLLKQAELWISEESRRKIGEEDLANLLGYFRSTVETELGALWPIVDSPGPGVLEIRVAITELAPANPYLNSITGIVPQGRQLSKLVELATGTTLFVGSIMAEAEVLDSVTGDRLAAGVDRRVGANTISNVGSTWGDVEDAYKFWARRIARNFQRYGMKPSREN